MLKWARSESCHNRGSQEVIKSYKCTRELFLTIFHKIHITGCKGLTVLMIRILDSNCLITVYLHKSFILKAYCVVLHTILIFFKLILIDAMIENS